MGCPVVPTFMTWSIDLGSVWARWPCASTALSTRIFLDGVTLYYVVIAAKSLKTRSKAPLLAHRLKRQSPKRSGRSRQGTPARNLKRTASPNRRLSAAVPPAARQNILDPIPLIVAQPTSSHRSAPPKGRPP